MFRNLLEIVSPKGRRMAIPVEQILLVVEGDDPTGPPALVTSINGVMPCAGETYSGLVARVALARSVAEPGSDTASVMGSPVPVYDAQGMRVLPNGFPDRTVQPGSAALTS